MKLPITNPTDAVTIRIAERGVPLNILLVGKPDFAELKLTPSKFKDVQVLEQKE